MWCIEELEENLSGRLKSVLLVALSALLLVCYGKAQIAVTEVNSAGAKVMLWEEENPVDSYFQGIETEALDKKQQYAYAVIYQECWEKEFANAYELLGQKTFLQSLIRKQAEQAAEHFQKYARAQGDLEAYCEYAQGEQKKEVDFTNAVKLNSISAETELLKEQTLKIYVQLLMNDKSTVDRLFVFSEQEAAKMLVQSGIGMANGDTDDKKGRNK